jgi:hypothetical protein
MPDPKYSSKEFQKLQAKWYKKIADAGHEEIEQPDGNLKVWASSFFVVHHDPVIYAAKEEYYRLAGQFLHDFVFANNIEKQIWAWHSEAVGVDDMHGRLKKKGITVGRNRIHSIVTRLARIMLCTNQT